MARFVAIPGRMHGSTTPGPVMWVSPERVVSVRPRMSKLAGSDVELVAELKLEGTPLFDAWLGVHAGTEAADTRWAQFIAELSG